MALFTAEEIAELKQKFETGELDVDSLMQLVHGKDIRTSKPFTRRLVVVGFFASDDDYRQEEFVGYLCFDTKDEAAMAVNYHVISQHVINRRECLSHFINLHFFIHILPFVDNPGRFRPMS